MNCNYEPVTKISCSDLKRRGTPNAGIYVRENGITFFCTASVLFNRVDLSKLSTFSIWFQMMFSLYPFATNQLTKSLECFLYLSKVERSLFCLASTIR